MMDKTKQAIAERVNQLEENYHFNLKEYSFIYKGKKAFIGNILERITMISPYMHYRKDLDQHINTFDLHKVIKDPNDFHSYVHKCMNIIANMLDQEQMGSVENYINHIWKAFDEAINGASIELMQNFIGDLSSFITMIDFSIETQLSGVSELQREGLVAQSILQNRNPDLEIGGFISIGNDGEIERFNMEGVKIGRMQCSKPNKSNKPKSIDLSKVRPLNTKEI